MIRSEDESRVVSLSAATGAGPRLPYTVELWDLARRAPERIIGRAASVSLARAIYAAAVREHLDRRVVLRRGTHILSDSHAEPDRP